MNPLLGIRGVKLARRKGRLRFMVRLRDKQGKRVIVGYAKCPLEAANLYDAAALEMYGKDAVLNNLTELTPEHEAHIDRLVDQVENPPPVFQNGKANWVIDKKPFVPTPQPPIQVFKDGKANW